jgi:hypothetical protein
MLTKHVEIADRAWFAGSWVGAAGSLLVISPLRCPAIEIRKPAGESKREGRYLPSLIIERQGHTCPPLEIAHTTPTRNRLVRFKADLMRFQGLTP